MRFSFLATVPHVPVGNALVGQPDSLPSGRLRSNTQAFTQSMLFQETLLIRRPDRWRAGRGRQTLVETGEVTICPAALWTSQRG